MRISSVTAREKELQVQMVNWGPMVNRDKNAGCEFLDVILKHVKNDFRFLVRNADLQQLGRPRNTRTHTKSELHTKKHSSSAWIDDDNSKSALAYLGDALLTKIHDKLENPTTKSETTQQLPGKHA